MYNILFSNAVKLMRKIRRSIKLIIEILVACLIFLFVVKNTALFERAIPWRNPWNNTNEESSLTTGWDDFSLQGLLNTWENIFSWNSLSATKIDLITLPQYKSCITPRGDSVDDGEIIIAYKSIIPNEEWICESELRTCKNWALDWSYVYNECDHQTSSSKWTHEESDSKLISDSTSLWAQLLAYYTKRASKKSYIQPTIIRKNNMLEHGTIEPHYMTNKTNNKNSIMKVDVLDQVTLKDQPNNNTHSCTTPRWEEIQHGETILAYNTDQATKEISCLSEVRACQGGTLHGSYTYQTCNFEYGKNHDITISTTENDNSSGTILNPLPQACITPWGESISHNSSIIAYKTKKDSTCIKQTRTCKNGALSGSFVFKTCQIITPSQPKQSCTTPRGQLMPHGETISAYKSGLAHSCSQEKRTCHDGVLDWSFVFSSCEVITPPPKEKQSCTTPWGKTIDHNESLIAYKTRTAYSCVQEKRTCHDGKLSGSFTYSSCTITKPTLPTIKPTPPKPSPPKPPQEPSNPEPKRSCTTPRGKVIPHGESVHAFKETSSSDVCTGQMRICFDGKLTGSFTYNTCEVKKVEPKKSCTTPRGEKVEHNEHVKAYRLPTSISNSFCDEQIRICRDGILWGKFTYPNCREDKGKKSSKSRWKFR